LVDPSPFSELTRMTGVPKYSILGVSTRFTDVLQPIGPFPLPD
jgi:hypothetical protein